MAHKRAPLRECAGMECAGVDAEAGIVRGVKLLGEESKNGRRYLPESVLPDQYENLPINLNHPVGPHGHRRVEDRFGWIEGAVKEGSDWRGDLHYNPAHPYAGQFAWLVKNKPSLVGLSHDAIGEGITKDGVFIVKKVISIKAVDLVAEPATTKGLFEAMEPELNDASAGEGEDLDSLETHIKNAVAAICGDSKLDLKTKVQKIKAALRLLEEPEEEERVDEDDEEEGDDEEKEKVKEDDEEEDEDKKKDMEESLALLSSKSPGVKKLVEEMDALKAKLAAKERGELVARLIEEARLPKLAVTDVFLAQLSEAKDERAILKLIEDRKQIASIQRPRSTGAVPSSGAAPANDKALAAALMGGR